MQIRRWPLLMSILAFGVLLPMTARAQWAPGGSALCTQLFDQLDPKACPDGFGGAIVSWADSRPGPYTFDLYAQRITPLGQTQWTANGVAICSVPGNQVQASLVSDGDHGAIIVWEDHRGASADIYVQRIGAGGTVLWTAGGVAVCSAAGDQFAPRITSDGAGGAIITWEDFRSDTDFDVYARRVNAAGVPLWTANGVNLCTDSEDQLTPSIASDGANGAIVAWLDSRGEEPFDIYAQRVDSSGVLQWTLTGKEINGEVNSQEEPNLAPDGAGGAILTWLDYRTDGFTSDIYAQRVNAAGTTLWAATGVPVCTAPGDQTFPVISSDGLGGILVAWEDSRSSRPQIFAQRVSTSGVARWTSNGLSMSGLAGSQHDPAIVSPSPGSAIVAWSDSRFSSYNADLYAQRVDSVGVAQWTVNGSAVTNEAADQTSPTMVAAGGGAIFAWADGRNGFSSDIYTQRVTAAGVAGPTVGVSDVIPLAFEMSGARPNPSRAGTTLSLSLPRPQRVTAEVFGIDGRRVRSLADDVALTAGVHTLAWDGRDTGGERVKSGIYLVRVQADDGSATSKATILE